MLDKLLRPYRTVATALSFVYFGLGGLLLCWLILPLLRLFTPASRRTDRCQDWVGRGLHGFWAFMHYNHVLRFRPPRWYDALPQGACMVVANHPTLIDVTAIWASYGRVHAVVQPYMFRNPLTHNLLVWTAQIKGPDGSIPEASRILNEMEALLRSGQKVVVFPEGTRSPEGGLHPFKRGAFAAACKANAPVVPLVFWMEPPMLAKEAPWYRTPWVRPVYSMHMMPPVDPAPWAGDSAALASVFEAFYRRILGGESAEAAYAATVGRGTCESSKVLAA